MFAWGALHGLFRHRLGLGSVECGECPHHLPRKIDKPLVLHPRRRSTSSPAKYESAELTVYEMVEAFEPASQSLFGVKFSSEWMESCHAARTV